MENIVAKLRETFREEVYELLAELETSLLELEKSPDDRGLIDRAFRAMHTIKGSGSACEFHEVASFTHDFESVFDQVRNGKRMITRELIDLSLSARDQIKAMLDVYYANGAVDQNKTEAILAEIKKFLPSTEGTVPAAASQRKKSVPAERPAGNVTYRIRFRPSKNIFMQGIDPVCMLNELRSLGHCVIVAQVDAVPPLSTIEPEACYTYWDVVLTTNQGKNAIEDVFIFVKGESELKIEVIDEEGGPDDEISYKKIGDILLDRGDLSSEALHGVLKEQKRVGELLVEKGLVARDKIESALAEQQAVREAREKRQEAETISSVRVATEKLDTLVNLVGELVTVQARLTQTAANHGIEEFRSIAEVVERLAADLRDSTMNIRMLPIGSTFSRFKRLVRTLSQELQKEIELTTDGAETELDKTVIERLGDPLVHLIRNSIDHGIETPSEREAAGKSKTGTIHLSASHVGANVQISIKDDGKGIDPAVIRAKGIERGLIPPNAELSEKEILGLIFEPGFSTAKEVTSVSGRGVGMDVVKKAMEALRGAIEIDSVKGSGTRILLTLPLTLAIIDGFLIRIGAENFIFPLALVEECVEITRKDVEKSNKRNVAYVRGQLVPYVRLRQQFRINGDRPAIEQIVITRIKDRLVGFAVDTIVGEHQTVLKSLGKIYQDVEGISGATILGDGTVALVLDVPKLVQIAEREEVARR